MDLWVFPETDMLNAERGINKGKINQDKMEEHVKGIKKPRHGWQTSIVVLV